MFTLHSKPGSPVRVTIVGEHQNGVLTLAVARCSMTDCFNRKKGRLIAKGRLEKGRYYSKLALESCSTEDFIRIADPICSHLMTSHKVFHPDVSTAITKERKVSYRKILTDKYNSIKSKLDKAGGPIEEGKIISIHEPKSVGFGRYIKMNPEE